MPEAINDLVLDVGNTRTKWALFTNEGVSAHGHVPTGNKQALLALLEGRSVTSIAWGSVARPDPGLLAALRSKAPVLVLSGASPSPLGNAYATPMSLGADRLANAVAAVRRFPGRPVLVIDAGTCITYDVCGSDGCYAGGAIAPGMRMRSKAMHAYSARLPEVDPPPSPDLIGTTTEASLAAGIHFGIVGEIEGFVRRVGKERPGLAVLITGGDGVRFIRAMESGIFALPLLTLEGYHALLVHHRALHGGTLGPDAVRADGTGPAG
jgi:type III pantothenate kinase